MATATVTSKGQITIPAEVRKDLNLAAGDQVQFFRNKQSGHYEIIPKNLPLSALFGILPKPRRTVTIEEMRHVAHERAAGIKRPVSR